MSDKYILDGMTPVAVEDTLEWAQWYENADRAVAGTIVDSNVLVSTVFLALDDPWDNGPPLLFETMIFGGAHDEEQWRYSTWELAEVGHERAVTLAKETP